MVTSLTTPALRATPPHEEGSRIFFNHISFSRVYWRASRKIRIGIGGDHAVHFQKHRTCCAHFDPGASRVRRGVDQTEYVRTKSDRDQHPARRPVQRQRRLAEDSD